MNESVRERIRKARLALGLTQKEAAELLEISQSAYSQVENGSGTVSDKNIVRIARVFRISEDWVRTGEGIMAETALMRELSAVAGGLTVESQKYLLDLARRMLEGENRGRQ